MQNAGGSAILSHSGRRRLQVALPHARFSRMLEVMEVHFTPELEAKVTHSAVQQGCNPDELVQEVVARYFEEESRFIEAVKRGEAALQRGEHLTHEQVGRRLERFLRS
jgi:predicted transcriptional regulator